MPSSIEAQLFRRLFAIGLAALTFSVFVGCDKREPAPTSTLDDEVRKPPAFHTTTQPAAEGIPASENALPPGHPPIGSAPAAGQAVGFAGDIEAQGELKYTLPDTWTHRPTRMMTKAVLGLPKADDDPEDAELTISHYPGMKDVPLQAQVDRWAGQFKQKDAGASGGAVKQTQVEGATYPTTLVDIAGTYQAGSMMTGQASPPKENYRLMVAIIETPQGPWFFKLVGPAKTIATHETEFVRVVREAK